jgi:hypothetical protein
VRAHRRSALGALVAVLAAIAIPASAEASFGIESFDVTTTLENGSSAKLAGSHPDALDIKVDLNKSGQFAAGDLRDVELALPPGFLINPTSIDECSAATFNTPRSSPHEESLSGEDCPNSTQVGVATLHSSFGGGTTRYFGIFNLAPRFGSPGAFGLAPFGVPIVLNSTVREADAGLTLGLEDISQAFNVDSLDLSIWGTPWSGSHNGQRGDCLNGQTGGSFGFCYAFDAVPAPAEQIKSYLTLPTTPCAIPLEYKLKASSWQGAEAQASVKSHDSKGNPLGLEKCNKALSVAKVALMTDSAASRTGLEFTLDVNDGGGILNPGGTARPAISKAVVSLPEGLTINPSLGSGLGTCSEADFAREAIDTPPGSGCPNASKVGDITIDGMLGLPEPLKGSVFIATPYHNPFGSLLSIYFVASNPRRGLFMKARGHVEPDPQTGRLVATFEELPRLLYTRFSLTFREGQRSVMVSPPACGSYSSAADLTSWADPNLILHQSTAFFINDGENNGPCPAGLAPFQPRLQAGSLNPAAGVYTPFFLHMTRADADQEITSYSARLPSGLLGNLRGIPFCPDAALEAAKSKTGVEELEHPSCPAASSIGHTLAGYGVGNVLAYAPGGLYLAGPYHGAPLSTVAIDSALVGPFDLGTVIVRSAIRVDPRSAVVSIDSAGSDPIPHILKGIPLHLRDIRVYIDRPNFTNTPTSCNVTSTLSTLTGTGPDFFSSADDVSATADDRYQVGNCTTLPFKPKLKFRFTSGFKRRAFPSLRTELRANPGDANLHFVSVTLPRTEFIAQEHLRNFCTKVQFAADACPPDSVYGKARAFTPLLDEPLEGPVYLRSSSGGGLPNMVFALSGRGGVRIEVVGKIDSVHESLRATFTELPDAPVSKFIMNLYGGKQGLIQNEKNICNFPQFANARLIGQNNTGEAIKPHLETRCPKKKKRANHRYGGSR